MPTLVQRQPHHLPQHRPQPIVFDHDDTLLSFDDQRLIEDTRATDCRERLRYEHKHTNADTLLGIPGAIAWCGAKGGPWRQLIAPAIVDVRDI